MDAWQTAQHADNIRFVPDGKGEFTEGMGQLVGKSKIGLGSHGVSYSSLQAVRGHGTTPQVYIDGQYVGGANELALWLAK